MTSASAPALLEARDLARHYIVSRGWLRPKAIVRALDGVSFAIAPAETFAVVGESGCGKSTLARQVTMIEAPTAGEIRLCGNDVVHASASERRRLRPLVQMVFQNPYASLNPRKNVGALIEEPLVVNGRGNAVERREKARSMMAKVGLSREHYARYPHMFSGGQRQRIAIARALVLEPKLVVADEPVSALDVSIQAQVLNLLMDLKAELRVAYLFISHNLQVVRHIADTVAVMYFGRIVEQAPKHVLFDAPRHPYTFALLASTPSFERSVSLSARAARAELPSPLAPPSGCAFHTRCAYAIERCRVESPALAPLGATWVACHRAAELDLARRDERSRSLRN